MKKKTLDLFDYHDYREFLKDWFEHARESQSLSLRDIAEKAELSTGYLPMILSGKRNLSEKALLKLEPIFKFNEEERKYMSALVQLSDASTAKKRLEAFERIRKSRSFREKSADEIEVYQYLSSWLNVAIREMAQRPDFNSDPVWIHDRLVRKVPLKEIEASLEFLTAHGFLLKGKGGALRPTDKLLSCFSGVYRLSLGEFHKQMFELASESIDNTPRDLRNLLGHTLTIPESKVETLRQLLDETLKKVQALSAGQTEPSPVYHVILSTFPVANKDEGES